MILSKKLLPFVLKAINWRPLIVGRLFVYVKTIGLFGVLDSRLSRAGYILRSGILFGSGVAYLFRIVSKTSDTNFNEAKVATVVEKNICCMMAACCFFCAERYRVRGMHPEKLIEFLNSSLKVERVCGGDIAAVPSARIKLARWTFQVTFMFCNWMMAASMATVAAFSPNLPVNMVFVFENENAGNCQPHWWSSLFGMALTLAGNFTCWDLLAVSGYSCVVEILTGALTLTNIQNGIFRSLDKVVAYQESNRQVDSESFTSHVMSYRAFQAAANRFNDSVQTILIALLLASGMTQIASVIFLIRQSSTTSSSIHCSLYAFFTGAALQATLNCLIVYGFAGDFYNESEKGLASLKRRGKNMLVKNARFRRHLETFLRSCPTVKIRFGWSNYIDRTTPLVFQIFCLHRIIDLLLLRK